jgi:glycosidase
MGCAKSKPERRRQGQAQERVTIGAPQNVTIHIPRNRVDQHGMSVQQVTRDIDRDTLLAALNHVSKYIAYRRQHITVIAVGGAVNTIFTVSDDHL